MVVLHPVRHGAALGLLDFFLRGAVCGAGVLVCENAGTGDAASRATLTRDAATAREAFEKLLAARRGRGVRIFAEGVRVAFSENFHHPAVKVIHGMIHDGPESSIVFAMCFFNVVFQSDAEIAIFAALFHLLRPQHLYILHRNFGYAIRPAVQLLLFGGQTIDIKIIARQNVVGNRGNGFRIVYRLIAKIVRAFRGLCEICAFVFQFFDVGFWNGPGNYWCGNGFLCH